MTIENGKPLSPLSMKAILQGRQKNYFYLNQHLAIGCAILEKALGHSLLLRTAEGIALTAQGEIFYDYL